MRLGRIGFDNVAGYLEDGVHSLEARPDLRRSTERLSPQVAFQREGVLVDVRGPREREAKRIAGSLSLPLNHLQQRFAEVPAGKALLVYCAGGYRSSIAASLLQREGLGPVSEIAGGIAAWEAAELPVETC